jgi:uncharacterized cupredoxin-like copper-binding protein
MIKRLAGVAALAVALTACGGSGTATTTTTPMNDGAGSPVTVHVTLTDFAIQSDLTTFTVGVPYHFVVVNNGGSQHEFMVIPPMAAGTSSDVIDAAAQAHIEETNLQPGEQATVDYTFTAGQVGTTLEFACHLQGHYEAGMHLPITVTG